MSGLKSQVAVVTGGASGIGRATAEMLAGAGASVAVADLDMDGANSTVERIQKAGGNGNAYFVDVAEIDAVAELGAAVSAEMGTATIVANVAGWDLIQPFLENETDHWRKLIDINLLGPIAVTRVFLDAMIAQGDGGRVINVASDAGRVGSTGETVYAGAKGGVIAFTKSLAREMARYDISVNCVCPGPTDTPLFALQPQKMREALVRAIPFRRLGTPEDVANAINFFAGAGASYITGQVLSVSGGLTMNG